MLKRYFFVSILFLVAQSLHSSQVRRVSVYKESTFLTTLKSGASFAWKHPWLCWLSCFSLVGGGMSRALPGQPPRSLAVQLFDLNLPLCTCEKAFVFYQHGLYLWAEIPKECKTKANYKELKKQQCKPCDKEVEINLANPHYKQELQKTLDEIRKKEVRQAKRPTASIQKHILLARTLQKRKQKIQQRTELLGLTSLERPKGVAEHS